MASKALARILPLIAGLLFTLYSLTPLAQGLTEEQEIEQQIARIEKKLETEPKAQGWMLVGDAYMHIKRYPDAVEAYREAYIISEYAKDSREKLKYALYMAGMPEPALQQSKEEN